MAQSPKTPRSKTPRGNAKDQSAPEEMDAAQEALFREVEEDLRAEQMQRLWKRYGGYVITAAAAVVAIVAGFEGWTAWQASVRAGEAERYFAADSVRERADPDPATRQLGALSDEGRTGYAALAALRRAEMLASEGRTTEAIVAYDALSAKGGAPQATRDLAAMLAALHALDVEDTVSVRGRLRPLTAEGNPWRPLAQEMLALLDLNAGDPAAARTTYQGLVSDPGIPDGVRRRAADMLAALGGTVDPESSGGSAGASGADGS